MSKQRWGLALWLSLGLSVAIGCGGDDDSGTGSSGAGTGGSSNGSAGKGSAGKGSTGSGGNITAEQAAAGACNMMNSMGSSASSCTGIDEYSQCALDMCGEQKCLDGACKPFFDCLQKAPDPCNPASTCTQSAECTTCETGTATCVANTCLKLLMCGKTESGGSCDQLDACCTKQTDANIAPVCKTGASGARAAGGDAVCAQLLSSLCPAAK